ncbi:LTA synthase family protein [Sphingobacterium sp. SGL-16]|uniref:LTA synthase family protein n=1 Tax=Sphingobacterium sp. SGL-16 TaxID=2710883 RepID=UPI0013EBB514|nr:alkaline phosphatase family protein [Sphingobacterium sp. SGL-16]NGM74808.1 sulfatase-like hydrolase/transferase [Sphingobacterium sp. SGL-16]
MNKPAWRSHILFLLSYFLYWYVLFLFDRTAFLISNWSKFEDKSDILYSYLYGIRLDASLACYFIALPFIFYIIQLLVIKKPVSPWWLRGYTLVPTVLFALITIVNNPLYESWGEKISKRAILLGAGTVGGVTSSIDLGMLIFAAITVVLYFVIAHYTYHGIVVRAAKYRNQNWSSILVVFVTGAFVLFAFIRGGFGRATLNPSAVYFSDNTTSNHLAVNTYWAFLKDMMKSAKKNPYRFMSEEEAQQIINPVLPKTSDTVENVLRMDRPNVVLILLEGMVAQVFEELGGEKGITPNLDKYMREGVNFTRAYSAADRSDKGMIAVMSGFPSQGTESIIQYIPKHEKLPAIGQIYDSLKYSTSFYHGGQSQFYNFKSYMFTHGIERVVDNADFDLHEKRNSWGVYDHVVAERMLQDLDEDKKPFFSIFYTLVNHEPYNLDGGYKFGKKTKADMYRSTAYYTDTMIGNFVERAKKKGWYDDTIFVVVSDHGNIYPNEKYGLEHPKRYHIPLFIFGGALKEEWKGRKMEQVVSQLDVATTLWNFVSDKPSPFKYSFDLFTRSRLHVAFYNSNSTFGIVTNEQAVGYDVLGGKVAYKEGVKIDSQKDSLIRIAKGYYQEVFKDFQNY